MKALILIIILSFSVILQSCDNNCMDNTMHEENFKEEILEVMMKQETEWNKGNIDGYMQGYWKSDSLRFASGNSTTFGWKSTLENYKKAYPDKSAMGTLEFTDIDIRILSADAAIVFGKWKLTRSSDEPKGLYTLLFKKINNEWKIVHDHTSSAK